MQFCLSKLALFWVLFFPGKQDKKNLRFFFFLGLSQYSSHPPKLTSDVVKHLWHNDSWRAIHLPGSG